MRFEFTTFNFEVKCWATGIISRSQSDKICFTRLWGFMKSVPDRVFFNDPSFFFSRTFYSRWAAHSSTTSTTSNYTAHFAQVIPRLRRRYIQPTRVSQLSHTSLPLSLFLPLSLSPFLSPSFFHFLWPLSYLPFLFSHWEPLSFNFFSARRPI